MKQSQYLRWSYVWYDVLEHIEKVEPELVEAGLADVDLGEGLDSVDRGDWREEHGPRVGNPTLPIEFAETKIQINVRLVTVEERLTTYVGTPANTHARSWRSDEM